MSLIKDAKEFFGLAPLPEEHDDAYYADNGSVAYAPRYSADVRERDTRDTYEPRGSYRASTAATATLAPRGYEAEIVAVEPRSYSEATRIGEPFRDGDAVTFELTDTDSAVAKRIIDFAAGLCFASRGKMHNLGRELDTERRVFAVVPADADFTVEDLQLAAGLIR